MMILLFRVRATSVPLIEIFLSPISDSFFFFFSHCLLISLLHLFKFFHSLLQVEHMRTELMVLVHVFKNDNDNNNKNYVASFALRCPIDAPRNL